MRATARAGIRRLGTSSSWTEVGAASGCSQAWQEECLGLPTRTGQEAAGQRLGLIADTDYVTALCSQMVYEGLVDDTFRIKCGRSQGSSGVTWGRAVVL